MRPASSYLPMFVLGTGIATAVLLWEAHEVVQLGDKDAESAPRPNSKITISRETTFIAGPLAKDGYVDYLAALNAISSQGVTPENNAAVLLYQVFGPRRVPEEKREHVAGLLGIKPLPVEGRYFVESSSFVRQNQKAPTKLPLDGNQDPEVAARDRLEKACGRPWSKDEFPLVAAWLEENERSLELVVAASHRTRFYFPLFGPGEPARVMEALLPMANQALEAAQSLITRAMFRLKAGRIVDAWHDVLACHRLARLIGQGPTIIEAMVGIEIEGFACRADGAIAHHGKLSGERARQFADDLRQLPPTPKMADKFVAERIRYLDAVSMIARRGPAEFSRLAVGSTETKGFAASLVHFAANAAVNWDEPMRMGNALYDRLAAAFAKPTRAERDAALKQIEKDAEQMPQQITDVKFLLGEFLSNSPRRTAGRQTGRMLVSLLLPAISAVAKAEDRGAAYSSLGQFAFALAAYRAEHGAYPTRLAQLTPRDLAAIPEDPFADGPMRSALSKYVDYVNRPTP